MDFNQSLIKYSDLFHVLFLYLLTEACSIQSDTSSAIRSLAIQGLDYLDTRTEFWLQQKPTYSRKRDKNMQENSQSLEVKEKGRKKMRWLLKKLEEIDEGNYVTRFW